jgi:proline iminopeptidase
MTERYLDLRGTTLFVDDRGDADAPALLFVHGGPGLGCWDFMHAQGDRLADRVRVIGVDQRGVLRSGPVGGSPVTVQTLVDDLEALREALGIASWTVVGHSAGGAYALDYASAHPESVRAVVFDCPCWDADSTDRNRLPVAARLLDEEGRHEAAERCRALAAKPQRLTADDKTPEAMHELGDRYQELFFADPEAGRAFDRLLAASGFGQETWSRGDCHEPLWVDMYTDRRPALAALGQPSLLLRGESDLVTSPQMVQAYDAAVPRGRIHPLARAAHFPCHEVAADYASVVTSFVEEVSG